MATILLKPLDECWINDPRGRSGVSITTVTSDYHSVGSPIQQSKNVSVRLSSERLSDGTEVLSQAGNLITTQTSELNHSREKHWTTFSARPLDDEVPPKPRGVEGGHMQESPGENSTNHFWESNFVSKPEVTPGARTSRPKSRCVCWWYWATPACYDGPKLLLQSCSK